MARAVSLSRSPAFGLAGSGRSSPVLVADPAQRRILRRHEAVAHRAEQVGGHASGPAPGSPSKAISARHGKSARKSFTRLLRPLAGPDITMKIPQRIHTLADRVPARCATHAENVVNGVKTIMVNEPLRAAAARRIAKPAVLRRAGGEQPIARLPGTRHGQFETADGKIIRDRRRTPPCSRPCARWMPRAAASARSPRRCRARSGRPSPPPST